MHFIHIVLLHPIKDSHYKFVVRNGFFVATYPKEKFIVTFSFGNQLLASYEIPHLSVNNDENQKISIQLYIKYE